MRTMPAVWASTALMTFALNFAASASLCEAAKPARRPIAEPAALIRLVTALRPRARRVPRNSHASRAADLRSRAEARRENHWHGAGVRCENNIGPRRVPAKARGSPSRGWRSRSRSHSFIDSNPDTSAPSAPRQPWLRAVITANST